MAAAASPTPSRKMIRAILVYNDPAFLRRNRIVQKLQDRGIEVLRSYEAKTLTPTAEALAEASAVILIADGVHEGPMSRWRALADQINARFFSLAHQTSGIGWRALEEWISRVTTESEGPALSERGAQALEYWKTQATALETDRAQALAKAKRLEADLEEATAQMAKMQRELTDARKLIELKTHDTHSSIKERDGLREQLAGYEDRFARVTKALQEKVAQLEEQKATLQNMVEGLKASAKQAADERDKARAELRTALDDRKELPEWMGEYSEEALAFIRKLDGLVQEGILEPHEARTKYTAKYGHAS